MSDQVVSADGAKPEDMRYFFISYSIGVGMGNTIQRQLKQADGLPDRGMNLSAASQILMSKFNGPVVILWWTEVPYERYMEWIRFLNGITFEGVDKKGPALGIVQGGGEKTEEKPKPELQVIKDPQT